MIDLIGQRFGRLQATEIIVRYSSGRKRKYVLCKCECGNQKEIPYYNLIKEKTKSCGCLCYERLLESNILHGMSGTRFYIIWSSMKGRCYSLGNPAFKSYGGRGILMPEEWLEFKGFLADMQEEYLKHVKIYGEKNTSIERIDNNKGYSKENCKWATRREQANNRRSNRTITYKDKTQTLQEWANELGVPRKRISGRIDKLGWSVEDALLLPKKINQFI